MKPVSPDPRDPAVIERQAAQWVLRRDRGLTGFEQDEFLQWLAADPRHGEALALHRWGWDELDRLTGLQTSLGAVPDPDLFAPRATARIKIVRQLWWFAPLTLAIAATVTVMFHLNAGKPPESGPEVPGNATTRAPSALAAPCQHRMLEDGSIVELNRGAAIEVAFTPTERRVRLVRGEGSFTVTKNPARPFIVNAGGVEVRAVGTVFNVRLGRTAVEVLVSEGSVKLERRSSTINQLALPEPEQYVGASQRAVVPLAPTAPPSPVTTLTDAEVEAQLAWRPRLLDFTDAPLAEIVARFNQRNPVQLVVADPALAAMRLSASFRSDNVEGFVRLMESDFGMKAKWHGEKEIVLTRAK